MKGFTLVEIIISIMILSIVAAIAIPNIVHDIEEQEQQESIIEDVTPSDNKVTVTNPSSPTGLGDVWILKCFKGQKVLVNTKTYDVMPHVDNYGLEIECSGGE